MSALLPDGIAGLGDCPFTLHEAIVTALRVLRYEELPPEERPPKRIWMDGEQLEAWWHEVDRQRKEKYGIKDDDDDGDYDENPAALDLIKRG